MLNQIKQLQEIIETQEEIIDWYELELERFTYGDEEINSELLKLENKLKTLKENYYSKYKKIE